jgi:hypothetical protein
MSILVICSIAFMTRSDFSTLLSSIISPKIPGTICQETPYLSVGQPHFYPFAFARRRALAATMAERSSAGRISKGPTFTPGCSDISWMA